MDPAGLWRGGFIRPILQCVIRKLGICMYFPLELCPNCKLRKFCHSVLIVTLCCHLNLTKADTQCDKLVPIIGLTESTVLAMVDIQLITDASLSHWAFACVHSTMHVRQCVTQAHLWQLTLVNLRAPLVKLGMCVIFGTHIDQLSWPYDTVAWRLCHAFLWCRCYQELNWSSLLSLSQSASDVEVDVIGAVIELSPAHSKRLLKLKSVLFLLGTITYCKRLVWRILSLIASAEVKGRCSTCRMCTVENVVANDTLSWYITEFVVKDKTTMGPYKT